jgi:hypothetical protein
MQMARVLIPFMPASEILTHSFFKLSTETADLKYTNVIKFLYEEA